MAKRIRIAQIYDSPQGRKLAEALKAEVQIEEIRFPKGLGEKHPFEFKICEDVYRKIGLPHAAVDKHVDFIISPGFHVTSDDPNAEKIINTFIKDTGFDQILRQWIKEGLIKGNGFLEIAIDNKNIEMKVVNANNMYIVRDTDGTLQGYNQYVGALNKFDIKKIVPFDPDEIAHLPIDQIGDSPYGNGIIYPMLQTIDHISMALRDEHMIMKRKANSPIHAKLGSPEEPATASDVAAFGAKFEYLNNLQEWATNHLVEFSVIDTGNAGDKFSKILETDLEIFYMGMQTPGVILGAPYQNEGIAKVQLDTFDRRIQSLQATIEKVVEDKVFGPILKANGIASKVDMVWGTPSEDQMNKRLDELTKVLGVMSLSPELRAMIEKEVATVLGYEQEDIDKLTQPEDAAAKQAERDREAKMKQPEVPGSKPNSAEMMSIEEAWKEEDINNDLKLTEWLNFDYMQYKEEVLKVIMSDPFNNLAGSNAKDYALGLLTPKQIERLRAILHDNFSSNGTIIKIANDIKEINLRDRYVIQDGVRRLVLTSGQRAIMIARTESTRLAAEGVLNNYQNQGVQNVRYVATLSDRTCDICLGFNGQMFTLEEARSIIPVHSNCRCGWIALQESSTATLVEGEMVGEFIKKEGNKWCVHSHQTGKNFGCYSSEEEAKKRLAQIHKFA